MDLPNLPKLSPFEKKAARAAKHRVRVTFKDGRPPFEGYGIGFTRALDNDPEVAEIEVKEFKEARRFLAFEEPEVEEIIILD